MDNKLIVAKGQISISCFDFVINKFGVLVKKMSELYFDFKIIKDVRYFKKEFFLMSDDAYKTQSVDYLLLREALKIFSFDNLNNAVVSDIGCGTGRLIAYLNYKFPSSKYMGYELNKDVATSTRHLFEDKENIIIISGDAVQELQPSNYYFLFNPFSPMIFAELLAKIAEKKMGGIFMYINISNEHLSVIDERLFDLNLVCLYKPAYSIINTNIATFKFKD